MNETDETRGARPDQTPEARPTQDEQPHPEERSGLSDQPSDERRMLPWVLLGLAVVALAAWGVVEWTGWGESRQEEAWKPEAPPPPAGRGLESMPPPPAPTLAYQQYRTVCQQDAPGEAERIPVYAATCLGHALETLRAAAGLQAAAARDGEGRGGDGQEGQETPGSAVAPLLEEADTAVLRLQRAADTGGVDVPVERLAVEAARAVLAVAREVAAGAEDLDPERVDAAAAAAEALDPGIALPRQGAALTGFFGRLGEALQPLAQPEPPPAPVPP